MLKKAVPLPRLDALTVRVQIRGVKRLRMRLWLAAHIFELGAWVAGTRAEVEVELEQQD